MSIDIILLVITLERMELEGSTRSHFEAISIFYRMVTRTGRRSDLIINVSSQMSLTKKFPFFRSHFGAFRVPWHDPCWNFFLVMFFFCIAILVWHKKWSFLVIEIKNYHRLIKEKNNFVSISTPQHHHFLIFSATKRSSQSIPPRS